MKSSNYRDPSSGSGLRLKKALQGLCALGTPGIAVAIRALALALLLATVPTLLACQAEEQPDPAGFQSALVAYVIDGDTIDVDIEGERVRVRLIGIDAPESANHDELKNTPEGDEATEFVRSLVKPGDKVFLQPDTSEYDRYGRLLRYLWIELPESPIDSEQVAEKMLNARIVAAGHAQAKRYEPDTLYADEIAALAK